MLSVTSAHNARLREAARLVASSRDRRKAGKCVLEGEHLVGVYVDRHGLPDTLVVAADALERSETRALAERCGARVLIVAPALFRDVAMAPVGVSMLAVVATPRSTVSAAADFCLLLDDVQDPGNVGTMLRTAAAAGVAQVWLSARCAFAWSPKVLRAGQGAHFCLDIVEDVDLAQWAASYRRGAGEVVATLAAGGSSVFAARLTGRVAIAIGNEGAGLSPALAAQATQRVSIPMPGGVGSLNAAAAAAVCLFECVRQRAGRAAAR